MALRDWKWKYSLYTDDAHMCCISERNTPRAVCIFEVRMMRIMMLLQSVLKCQKAKLCSVGT